ncbi:adhesion G protein-coupled receptor E1-like isoform X1 [Polypterus senegalus]|uniref:adhesion G protein-coupled receptor E1-like isoform X1 n=1 Tax=Polypterus senegalus TaxID=55291 RepID=UPI001966080D|nr:adhesion G protein-coupled receptor E1-like isoform X1 [Polypterus senegalus]
MSSSAAFFVAFFWVVIGPCVQTTGDGLIKLPNGTSVDHDECSTPDFCSNNSLCVNTYGSYYCQCQAGYRNYNKKVTFTFNESNCRDINECIEQRGLCGPNTTCRNTLGNYSCSCQPGFTSTSGQQTFRANESSCQDIDECRKSPFPCGLSTVCLNTPGSFSCSCIQGFRVPPGQPPLRGTHCEDIDECTETPEMCGPNANCTNTPGRYTCSCQPGFTSTSGQQNFRANESSCQDIDECTETPEICGPNANCTNTLGNYSCSCSQGFMSTAGIYQFRANESTCEALNCSKFDTNETQAMADLKSFAKKLCEEQMSHEATQDVTHFKNLVGHIEGIISRGQVGSANVSEFFNQVEDTLMLIAPLLPDDPAKQTMDSIDAAVRVRRGTSANDQVVLQTEGVVMETDWETAVRHGSPGFAAMFLVTYGDKLANTEKSIEEDLQRRMDHVKLNSKIATASVGSRKEVNLARPVNLTFSNLEDPTDFHVVCVYWKSSGGRSYWSKDGCHTIMSNVTHTTCRADHLSSFAVLMALYNIEDIFELKVITWVGLSLSLICLALCILTFFYCRAIQGPRNTIHLHLCISLFIADLVFLAGISSTNNKVGCAVVAGLLHFFFMAAFTWMCLEGIQLYRMVVLVFNTTLNKLYMFAFGYGVPAAIVLISASVKSSGYGTKWHCWLSLDDHFIWSFFGPVCLIIVVNVVFFIITVWKLAEKFTSLNPDMPNLKKVKAFTITAIAQLCILGSMWIFGCFQFEGGSIVMTYLFTILNSVQGVFIFIMHCLLSNQVRDEYKNFMATTFNLKKKTKYSEFSSTSNSSSNAQSKSVQNTGESHM